MYFRGQRMAQTRPPLDRTFFETVEKLGIALSPALRSYMRQLMREDPLPERIRALRMEEFFKDLFFDFQDERAVATTRAYTDLVNLYVRTIATTTNWLAEGGREGAPVGRVLALAADKADEVDVLTFNHDLVIENEIFRRARLRNRWCLDYGYGSFRDELNFTPMPPGTPLFPLHEDGSCSHTRGIRILKLHGSLNWFTRLNSQRPTARTLSGEAGSREVLLNAGRKVVSRAMLTRRGAGRSSWYTWPVIIPPVYAKQALRRRVQTVWQDARSALERCERLLIFGYSLPQIDVEAEKLIERGIARNPNLRWVDVVDPSSAAAQRYAGLAPSVPIRWYPSLKHFAELDAF